jgi:hypothetical protein
MTIEQTVEIPADHRLVFDLPRDLPSGRAKVEVTITPLQVERFLETKHADAALENSIDERQRKERDEYRLTLNPVVSLLDLRGSCKGDDTMEAFFERQRADKAREDVIDEGRRGQSL